jgi:cytochrome c oxidase subunit 2
MQGSFWLPPGASTFAASHDGLFYFIYWLCVIFFVLIVGAMGYFAWTYRRKSAGQTTSNIRGSHTLEIAWSVIPSFFLVAIFFWGFTGFMHMMTPPGNTLDVRVTGQKWFWNFTYPNGGNDTALTVPVGQPVRLTMSSTDVLHSFYIPAFRMKRDVLPNRYTVIWFEATELGRFPVFCTEYCGKDHSQMITWVNVVPREDYQEYVQGLGGCPDGDDLAACGAAVYSRSGCAGCHSVDGSPNTGPTFQGLYGATRNFVDGTSETADDNYIRTSIVNPNVQVVQGYSPVMPGNYGSQLNEEQINALVEYIRSLGQ